MQWHIVQAFLGQFWFERHSILNATFELYTKKEIITKYKIDKAISRLNSENRIKKEAEKNGKTKSTPIDFNGNINWNHANNWKWTNKQSIDIHLYFYSGTSKWDV